MNSNIARKERIVLLHDDLTQAAKRLSEALRLPPTDISRDACIKRFEFCFELSWKLLAAVAGYKGLDVRGPRDAIRTGAQLDVVSEPENWLDLLDARNMTVHVYQEAFAKKVYNKIKRFPALLSYLLDKTGDLK